VTVFRREITDKYPLSVPSVSLAVHCHTARSKRCAPLIALGAQDVTEPLWFVTVTVRFALNQLGNAVEVSTA